MTKAVDLAKTGSLVNSSGQIDLTTGVTGVLPVANGGTGSSSGVSPGGSDRQVQFNNAGAFGGNSGLVYDSSGNLGLGVTPSAWGATYKALQVGQGLGLWGRTANNQIGLSSNVYSNASNYVTSDYASSYQQYQGAHSWYTAPSGTAGNAITFTQAMTLDASGNLLVGGTTAITANGNGITIGNGSTQPALNLYSSSSVSPTINFAKTASSTGSYQGYIQYNMSSDAMVFATVNSERMRIDSSGYVGIGTNSPAGVLDIRKSGAVQQYIISTSATAQDNAIASLYNNGAAYSQLVFDALYYKWSTSGTEQARIDSAGLFKFNSGYGSAATAYGCRAWANFASNGSTLRASGGITSITVPSTGNITVNLSFTMPDTNYMYNVNTGLSTSSGRSTAVTINCSGSTAVAPTTTAFSIGFLYGAGFTAANSDYINISVHR